MAGVSFSMRVLALASIGTLVISAAVVLSQSAGLSTATAAVCPATDIWLNEGGAANNRLLRYSPSGVLVSSVTLTGQPDYGDIAMTRDGGTIYGIPFQAGPGDLAIIDAVTGVVRSTVTVTGADAAMSYNSLALLPDGDLLAGGNGTGIFTVDPATGAAALWGTLPSPVTGLGGDFVPLPDGDVFAIGVTATSTVALRLHPDHSIDIVGTLARGAYGIARSGTSIDYIDPTGTVFTLGTIPTTPSSAPIADSLAFSTGLVVYGATSPQDTVGACDPPTLIPSTTVRETVGQSFRLAVSGPAGTTPIRYFVSAGALPAGVSLDPASGVISGRATVPGTSTVTVGATNDFGTVSAIYTVVIEGAPTLAETGGNTSPLIAALALIIGGIMLLVIGRRRSA